MIGPAAKQEAVETLRVDCCRIGSTDYEEDEKEVYGKQASR